MILVQNLGLHFAGSYLFENVNFRINKNDRIGLAGKNGAGKSTLLKILSGEQPSTEGNVEKEGEVRIGFLKQDLDFEKGRTVWDEAKLAFKELNIINEKIDTINHALATRTDYESEEYHKLIHDLTDLTDRFSHLGGYNIDGEIEKILKGLGFKESDFNRLTDDFSGGWRMRIELAKLLLEENDVLLLDEPTNHLDIESIIWLESFLITYSGAVVLVSHDKQFLTNVTNRTIEISNKSIQDYKANYTKYLILRQERKEKLLQQQKNQEQEIKRTEQLINKFRAKATKASFAQSLMKKLDKVERIEVEDEDITRFNIRFEPSITPGKIIFKAENLGKSFDTHTIFENANFYIERGEKIAFIGQNGQGKTTMARIMDGLLSYQGKLEIGHNVQIGYFAQNQSEELNASKTILEEAEDSATEESRPKVRDLLGSFLFQGDDVHKKVSVLSGGERNRLALCKLLLRPFNTLIMDEPTNHLDIQSKAILKHALKNFTGTLILVSHDREFLDDLADKIFEFRNGEVKEFLGNINEYLEYRKKENMREVDIEKSTTRKVTSENTPTKASQEKQFKSKEQKSLENKLSKLENDIEKTEQKISAFEDLFSKENPKEEDIKEYSELKEKLTRITHEWENMFSQLNG
ncbi:MULTISPECIES: ATP-binding cassette domain-containing protein [Apibacter]|uniref:ATP-binding cassette domain-containing protein n=1 Tax=Apibacter TaxID=1778601 RepID=UPI0013264F9E|nr:MULTISPECIES: ATP-binding cassette domain-containing protein [Apibacter]MCX8676889.1 ATP-binding cassette domain-containing protein [Apibacter sp. B3919]MXO24729.1 ATP-binding cassette domain-containing protein [Apibacter sp. B3924]MXO25973.1 ATP-binding cassette domain-containing protein [Apibacter sp. B3813]MXO27924.1 ATP-binding cassette domain-containing protein [Apibacter sp. B3913]MXO29716.1 ATP-binding cassette domain-containing protein [Apibacter sp. B3912]